MEYCPVLGKMTVFCLNQLKKWSWIFRSIILIDWHIQNCQPYKNVIQNNAKNVSSCNIIHVYVCVHQFSSVQFSPSVMSDSLWPHESQHARPPCPSPTPGAHWDSRPSSQWCHPAISSSVVPFSSCPQSLPASVFSNESTLHMRWPKYWSFSFSIIPFKEIPGLMSFRMVAVYIQRKTENNHKLFM